MQIKCESCGELFSPQHSKQKYCHNLQCKLAAKRKRYAATRAKGKCTNCGAPSPNAAALCPACASRNSESVDRKRVAYKAEGLCIDCGKPAAPNKLKCETCAARGNLNMELLRKNRLREGLCATCGKRPVFKSESCKECWSLKIDSDRARRASRRQRGVCVACEEPAYQNADGTISSYCLRHLKAIYGKRHKRYWDRRSKGLCVSCGKPADLNERNKPFAYCESCRDSRNYNKFRRRLRFRLRPMKIN